MNKTLEKELLEEMFKNKEVKEALIKRSYFDYKIFNVNNKIGKN